MPLCLSFEFISRLVLHPKVVLRRSTFNKEHLVSAIKMTLTIHYGCLQCFSGEYQGPSLTVVLEGAVLSMEELCILQLHPPWNLRGQTLNYGSGLLSCYQLCDISVILSDGFLYLFDPSGLVFSTSLSRDDSLPSESARARMYSLLGKISEQSFISCTCYINERMWLFGMYGNTKAISSLCNITKG